MKIIVMIGALLLIGCTQEPQTLDELRTAGQNAYIDSDFNNAKDFFHKALHIKSSDRDVLYYLGQTFQKLNQDDSAVYYLKRADILHPNDRELNLAIYQSTKKINDYENCIKAIDIMVKTGDPLEPRLFELANLNLKAGNIFVSFLLLKKIWESKTDEPHIYLALGNVAVQVDSIDFAINIMREAIEKFGNKDEYVTNLAIYLSGTGRLPEAEETIKKILKKDPNSQPLRFNFANILSKYDSKVKKQQALDIYVKLRQESGNVLNLDSLIIDLHQQLE